MLHLNRWICTTLDMLSHTHKYTHTHKHTHTHTHIHTQFFHENPYAFESLDLHEFLTQQDQTLEMTACRDLLQVYMALFKEPLLNRALFHKKIYCRYVYRAICTKETLFDNALLRSVVGIFTALFNRRVLLV